MPQAENQRPSGEGARVEAWGQTAPALPVWGELNLSAQLQLPALLGEKAVQACEA